MSAPTNPPAFPELTSSYADADDSYGGTNPQPYTHIESVGGMSLRDYFAGQALIAMVARTEFLRGNSDESRARWAYRLADAMLAERAK